MKRTYSCVKFKFKHDRLTLENIHLPKLQQNTLKVEITEIRYSFGQYPLCGLSLHDDTESFNCLEQSQGKNLFRKTY